LRRSVMTAALAILAALSVLAAPSGAAGPSRPAPQAPGQAEKAGYSQRGAFVPGELLVTFRRGVSRGLERTAHAAVGARVLSRIGGGRGIDHVRLSQGLTVAAAVQRYESNPTVEYAEPNFYRYPAFTPNDTNYNPHLWALNNAGPTQAHFVSDAPPSTASGAADADMDVAEAWDTEKGDPGVIVAVIDSGVDTSHPDLAGNLWVNAAEAAGTPGVDDDVPPNGRVDDINGYDFADNDATLLGPSNALGFDHGTHVAGTIAGVTNNGAGISGVCGGDAALAADGCSIMVLKFMDNLVDVDGNGTLDMVGTLAAELAAISYARTMGADIINASYGGPSYTASERERIRLAGSSGILFVAAAANDSLDNDMSLCMSQSGPCSPAYPASYNLSNILSVAASNHQDEYGYFTGCASPSQGFTKPQCAFTNFGRYSVDVAAPGVDVLSTVPGNNYATFNGTSMAAPHAAGVAGLLESQDPTRTPATLKNIIMATADTTTEDGVTRLDVFDTMNTVMFTNTRTGQFTRSRARVNAEDALAFAGTPPNGSANHDGDIPGAVGMSGTQVSGGLAWPADVNDVRRKRLSGGKTYRFTLVVPSGRDFDLFLLRSNAKEIWQPGTFLRASVGGPGADETFTFRPGSTATFFIHMSWWFGQNGSYTLKVVCIRNC
jgi:subtilisin family serine protease